MKKIDGKEIAAKKLLDLKDVVEECVVMPALAVILVGNDPASHLYVKLKEKAAKEIGVELRKYVFEEGVSRQELVASIEFLNIDPDTHGIIVQLPLPEHLESDDIVSLIDPEKDVDGFHRVNQEKFIKNEDCVYPVFPGAIMTMIESCTSSLSQKNAVVVGKSDVFDRVMTHALAQKGATVNFITFGTRDFSDAEKKMINDADIIVTACGSPDAVSCDLISDSTIVIDGGISKVDKKVVGDVDISNCGDRDITISSVPGGVGPVTISCLLENLVQFAKKQSE